MRPAPRPSRPAAAWARGLVAVALALSPASAWAHHDGPVLPLSLNAPGAVGGLGNPAGQTETKFGVVSRAFSVSNHALYGNAALGGEATVLFNGLYGAIALSPRWSVEALMPVVTDLPHGPGGSRTGLGDLRLGARWFSRWGADTLVSLSGEGALPTGDADRGFGAGAAVSRASGRLAHDFAALRLRLFIEAGLAWAWESHRGTIADAALSGMWQALGPLGLFWEVRALTALERGRDNPLEFVGRARAPGDTSFVITPAVMLRAGHHVSLAVGPQIPLGFRDFDFGVAASATYRLD